VPPPDRFRLGPFEIAAGFLFGADPHAPPLPSVPPGETVQGAVERALLPALAAPPCVIAFSGGLDSSALLAVATRVARRQGLEEPIPVTMRYPGKPEAQESEWQELVIRHVGVTEWRRIDVREEIDLVGPAMASALRRHGVVYPANSHALGHFVAIAGGRSYVMGFGGDDFFWPSPFSRHAQLLAAATVPTRRDLRRLAYAAAPSRARLPLVRRRHTQPFSAPWLTDEALRRATDAWQRDRADQPVRASAHVRWTWRRAAFQACLASFSLVAADTGVRIHMPLADPRVVAALAETASRRVGLTRGEAMRTVFGDVLPDALYGRTTKAYFDDVYWNRYSSRFSERAVEELTDDDEYVDAGRLRAFWREEGPLPKAQAAILLQELWLRYDARPRTSVRAADARAARPIAASPSA
jgi:asparagine synthetase B (glutamine-hydrolysing)